MRLLHVDSSVLGSNSVSRLLTSEIVEAERRRTPGLSVVHLDLAADPLPHLSGLHLAAAQGAAVPEQTAGETARGVAALDDFLAADVVVIGAPMYNFSIPSQLKSWIDRLAIAGKTFSYGPEGVKGLAGGKRVIVASTRGGLYGAGTAMAFLDHQETYLRAVFGFFGITSIEFVRAEGMKMTATRDQSIENARASIAALA